MVSIELEDIATVFASEFVKYCNKHEMGMLDYFGVDQTKFLKKNFAQRRKLVEKVLKKMEDDRFEK
jgi:hypothetical protein